MLPVLGRVLATTNSRSRNISVGLALHPLRLKRGRHGKPDIDSRYPEALIGNDTKISTLNQGIVHVAGNLHAENFHMADGLLGVH